MEIISKSACSECHAKMMCSMSDMKVKTIEVKRYGFENFEVGEEVNVVLASTVGYKAVVVSYLIPLVILLILLLSLQEIYANELISALGSIAGVGIYYLAVWLSRRKIERQVSFAIEKL